MKLSFTTLTILAAGLLTSDVQGKKFVLYDPNEPEIPPDPPFKVLFDVQVDADTEDQVLFEVIPEWAPVGSARFRDLVEQKYFDGCAFFRVLPDFAVQWGISGNPVLSKNWRGGEIPDEDIGEIDLEKNTKGTLTFAHYGKNTRSTQLFVNMKDNPELDENEDYAPIGRVLSGMEVLEKLYSEYGEDVMQNILQVKGDEYLNKFFPKLSHVKTARLLPDSGSLGAPEGDASEVAKEE